MALDIQRRSHGNSNSGRFWNVLEASGSGGSGQLWTALGGSQGFSRVLEGSGQSWTVLKGSRWLWTALDVSGRFRTVLESCCRPSRAFHGSGGLRLDRWSALDCLGTGSGSSFGNCSGKLWTDLDGFGWLWNALESSQELARNFLHVRNHALTSAGKHILLNRCYASLERDCCRKSQNRVLTGTFFSIQQDSVGCYVRNSKCRKRALTTGEETIFENLACQLVRRQKSTIFKNIALSIGESTNSE